MINIDFTFDSTYGTFRDALWLPEDHTFTEEEITAMKQQRFDNWLAIIESPQPEPEIVEIDGVVYDKVEIDGQIFLKPVEA